MSPIEEVRSSNSNIWATDAPKVVVSASAKRRSRSLSRWGFLHMKVYFSGRNRAVRDASVDGLCRLNPQAEIVRLEGQVSLLAETSASPKKLRQRSPALTFCCSPPSICLFNYFQLKSGQRNPVKPEREPPPSDKFLHVS